jgi:hypothetical protein
MSQKADFFWGQEVGTIRKRLPIPERKLGFYCVAGIEPSELDESGVMRRTNQDRAWVATPLHHEVCVGTRVFACLVAS